MERSLSRRDFLKGSTLTAGALALGGGGFPKPPELPLHRPGRRSFSPVTSVSTVCCDSTPASVST